MTGKSFGDLLNDIILISRIKKNVLASYLKYDASYLSKWVHNISLPSPKYINVLCKNISSYISSNACEDAIEALGEHLGLAKIDINRSIVKDLINTELLESYQMNGLENPNNFKASAVVDHCNTITSIYPKNVGRSLIDELNQTMKSKTLDAIFISDICYINDKILYLEVVENFSNAFKENNSRIRYIITNKNIEHDLVFNCIIIIYIAISYPQLNHDIYVTGEDIKFSICAIKDTIATISNYLSSDVCLSISVFREQEHVHKLFSTNDYYLGEKCIPLFKKYSPQKLLQKKIFNNFIINSNISLIIGNLNELFFDLEMFSDISNRYFEEYAQEYLQEINMILNNITYKSNIRVLLRRVEIIRFVSTGIIHFFNKKIVLSPMERIAYLKHMADLFKNNNIDVKMVEQNIIEQLPDNPNFSLYVSNGIVMTKNHVDSGGNNFFVVQDRVFQESYMKMFDVLWEDNTGRISHDKSQIIDFLNNMSKYSEFMK